MCLFDKLTGAVSAAWLRVAHRVEQGLQYIESVAIKHPSYVLELNLVNNQ